jgi:hypothetical protein
MKINAMQQRDYFDLIHALLIMMKVIALSHPGLHIPRIGPELSFELTMPVECDLASNSVSACSRMVETAIATTVVRCSSNRYVSVTLRRCGIILLVSVMLSKGQIT